MKLSNSKNRCTPSGRLKLVLNGFVVKNEFDILKHGMMESNITTTNNSFFSRFNLQSVFLLLLLVFSSVISTGQQTKSDPRPRVTIKGTAANKAAAEITSFMIAQGYETKQNTPTMMVFEKKWLYPTSDPNSAQRIARVTYSITESASATKIVASCEGVTPKSGGREVVSNLNKSNDSRRYQVFLNELKTKLEETNRVDK